MSYTDEQPNYSSYSLDELTDALKHIDKESYPERVKQIESLIAEKGGPGYLNQRVSTAAPTDDAGFVKTVQPHFLGSGKEYFSIWIVNLLLSIVTLGIYSAWATVRNKRYLYSNVELDGHRFSFLAQPIQILIGRAIGVGLFALYYVLSVMSPALSGLFILALFVLTPVLVCLAVRFRMRMTGYRNVRFGFDGSYGRAFVVFVAYSLLAVFTFGLCYPLLFKKIDEFLYENMRYGNSQFSTDLSTSEYYVASLAAGGIAMVVGFIFGLLGAGAMAGLFAISSVDAEQGGAIASGMAIVGVLIMYVAVFAIAQAVYQTFIRNHVFAQTQINQVARFTSQVKVGSLLWLRVSNLLLLVGTLGFAMPWVKVRTIEYFAACTQVHLLEGYENVLANAEDSASAIADETSNIFDVDIAIG
uniref:YjgN family protein n=1 Tax=Ningiella ruwaisensis TaxID=2364274 RepID=UPI001445C2A6|nr:YjgN family protein [Ningiella ruwaisensis]